MGHHKGSRQIRIMPRPLGAPKIWLILQAWSCQININHLVEIVQWSEVEGSVLITVGAFFRSMVTSVAILVVHIKLSVQQRAWVYN